VYIYAKCLGQNFVYVHINRESDLYGNDSYTLAACQATVTAHKVTQMIAVSQVTTTTHKENKINSCAPKIKSSIATGRLF
jgi:hypothetical protein